MRTAQRRSAPEEYRHELVATLHGEQEALVVVEVQREFRAKDISLDPCHTGGVAIEIGDWLRISFPDQQSARTALQGLAGALAKLVPKEEED